MTKQGINKAIKPISISHHELCCTICRHEQRAEIERAFVSWKSPAAIAEEFGLNDRSSVYRHANAFQLFSKRQRNVKFALERMIEQAGEVPVTSGAIVAAIQAYTKINAAGEWVDKTETVSLDELFLRMSPDEMQTYVETGRLPAYFPQSALATAPQEEREFPDGNQ